MGCSIILLAGGSGKRMNAGVPKQYMEIHGKPLLWYALDTIEKSPVIEHCVLVAPESDWNLIGEKIISPGNFHKVKALAPGGRERFESVLNGLGKLKEMEEGKEIRAAEEFGNIILIHDGARPFLSRQIIRDCCEAADKYRACVAAVPSKDTVAIEDGEGFEKTVPERRFVWNVQTPQAFQKGELYSAFGKLQEELYNGGGLEALSWVTDDAGVVEHYNGTKIKLVYGDYRNIKVTTPEDLGLMKEILSDWQK